VSEINQDLFDELVNLLNKQQWQLGEIKSKYLLKTDSNNEVLLNILGLFLSSQEKFSEAESIFKKAIKKNRFFLDAYNNLCLILKKQNKLIEAENLYKQALLIDKENSILNNNYGVLLKESDRYSEALVHYKIAIKSNNNYYECYNNLGNLYHKLKSYILAKEAFNNAIKINPNYSDSYNNLANIELEIYNNIELAFKFYHKAVEINNKFVDAIHNLGNLYLTSFNFDKSFYYLNQAITLDNNFSSAWNSLGKYYYLKKNYKKAAKCYLRAIKKDKDNKDPYFNLGVLYIRCGKYKKGWFLREKKRIKDIFIQKHIDKLWDGKKINGNLLVWREQGIGDEILFLSQIYSLKNFAKKIFLEVDIRLIDLFKNFLVKNNINNIELLDQKITVDYKTKIHIEDVDKHISIGSLGCYLRNTKSEFLVNKFPYLIPNQKDQLFIKNRINNSNKLKVGISWKTGNLKEKHRNIPLTFLKKIFDLKFCDFFNLQFSDYNDDINFFRSNYNANINNFDFIDYKNDINLVSALISELDLVITVQNAVAHLSCALGKETFVMLSFWPRFNWGMEQKKTDWYPTATIYSQKNDEEVSWKKVVDEVVLDILKKNATPKF
jgi:tetratricopeptide (TPR) repeat protein